MMPMESEVVKAVIAVKAVVVGLTVGPTGMGIHKMRIGREVSLHIDNFIAVHQDPYISKGEIAPFGDDIQDLNHTPEIFWVISHNVENMKGTKIG